MVLFQRVGYNNTTTIKHQTNKIHILGESQEFLHILILLQWLDTANN